MKVYLVTIFNFVPKELPSKGIIYFLVTICLLMIFRIYYFLPVQGLMLYIKLKNVFKSSLMQVLLKIPINFTTPKELGLKSLGKFYAGCSV